MIKQDIYNSNDISIKHDIYIYIYIYKYMISSNNKQIVNTTYIFKNACMHIFVSLTYVFLHCSKFYIHKKNVCKFRPLTYELIKKRILCCL